MNREQYFDEVLQITQEQSKVLEQKDIDNFNALLERREEVIKCINEEMSTPLVEKEIEIIHKVTELDRMHAEMISKLYDALQQEVRQFRRQSKTALSYETGYNPFQESGYYFDKRER